MLHSLLQYRKYRVWALVYRQPLCQEHLRSSFVQNGTTTVFINPLVTTCCIPKKTKHTAPLTLHAVTVIIKSLLNHHLCIRITSSPCLCNQFTCYNFYLNYPLVSVSMQSPVLLLIQLCQELVIASVPNVATQKQSFSSPMTDGGTPQ